MVIYLINIVYGKTRKKNKGIVKKVGMNFAMNLATVCNYFIPTYYA